MAKPRLGCVSAAGRRQVGCDWTETGSTGFSSKTSARQTYDTDSDVVGKVQQLGRSRLDEGRVCKIRQQGVRVCRGLCPLLLQVITPCPLPQL